MEPVRNSTLNELPVLSISSITGFPGEFGPRRNAAHSAFLNLRKNSMTQFAGIISSMMGNMSPITADQVQTEKKIRPHTPAQRVDVQAEHKAVIFDYQDLKEIAGGSICLLYTSPSPRDLSTSRMPSSA